jgi:signal transduction histidine kinase
MMTFMKVACTPSLQSMLARKRVKRSLRQKRNREAERLAQATLDSLAVHIAILDAQGSILAVNRAWRQFASTNPPVKGNVAEQANYLTVCDRASGDSSEEAQSVAHGIRAVIAGESENFTLEYPCHSPTRQRWFNLHVTRLPGSGSACVVVAHENITERKLTEESIRRRALELQQITEALERTNRELDQFAYVTSHDLKAPLRGIANLSSWIEEDLGDDLNAETRRQMDLLRGRVLRMEAMIDGILQYSRIGREQVRLETVDVGQLLADSIDLLAPPPRITLSVALPMPILRVERIRLQQVFMNLISNAIKHNTRTQGRVAISVRDLGGLYEFAVADDGPGIAPQYHDQIFVIFQTLEARDKVDNTGIGLSLVKKIVEAQGGTVTVESAEGAGATFRFTWPKEPVT